MNRYTIYCSEQQTKKALELGAPIDFRNGDRPYISVPYYDEDNRLFYHNYHLPTAEQLLCWLEEQEDIEEITILRNRAFHSWAYLVTNKWGKLVSSKNIYHSRKESTLAAIDAALNYLTAKKGE